MSDASKRKSAEKQREQIIDAGDDIQVWGDSSEDYNIEINEANVKGNYADLDSSDIHQDIYNSTYLHSVSFDCVQSFGDIFKSKKGVEYDDTVKYASEGLIGSYGTIVCDTEVGMSGGSVIMDIKGYDRNTGAELFTARADVYPCFGSYSKIGEKDIELADDMVLTADDIWPQNVGLMKLDGRNAEQIINNLPVLCDKRNVEIDGDTLRIPMSEATAQIMKDKGMIYGFESKNKESTMQVSDVKLNEGLLTEKDQTETELSK